MAIDGVSAVPEPAALILFAVAGLAVGGVAVRRRVFAAV
jgi:hypothetical protein